MNMIGKSGTDWSKAPKGATHKRNTLSGNFYKLSNNSLEYWDDGYTNIHNHAWRNSQHNVDYLSTMVSKEEDLKMDKAKEVRSIADLEVGMFLESVHSSGIRVVTGTQADTFETYYFHWRSNTSWCEAELLSGFKSWSYTYKGEYTPIIKESEKDKKLKELEETIAAAKRQIKELTGK
jgi:hypothetical protein